VKLADFGLARLLEPLEENGSPSSLLLTDYVATRFFEDFYFLICVCLTRWYRAPEILLGSHHYTYSVDMWSMGCIFGEMLSGKPLFPGSSTSNQLERIIELTGYPPQVCELGNRKRKK
jgi:mitogen-activated protein kinase 15